MLALLVGQIDASAQRRVEGTTITCDTLPAIRLELEKNLTLVGTQTVTLSVSTRAEQHFFVDSYGGRIRRLYSIQFEGKPEGAGCPYDCSGDPTIDFGGRLLHTNFRFYPRSRFAGRSGSDGDQAQRLLERHGYRLGSDLARVRLVGLLDDPPFNELMIIYLEDLSDHGLSVADLRGDPERWDELAAGLLRRALEGMQIPLQTR